MVSTYEKINYTSNVNKGNLDRTIIRNPGRVKRKLPFDNALSTR